MVNMFYVWRKGLSAELENKSKIENAFPVVGQAGRLPSLAFRASGMRRALVDKTSRSSRLGAYIAYAWRFCSLCARRAARMDYELRYSVFD